MFCFRLPLVALRVHPAAHGYVFLSYFLPNIPISLVLSFPAIILIIRFFVLENEWELDYPSFFLILSYSFIGFAIIFLNMGTILC